MKIKSLIIFVVEIWVSLIVFIREYGQLFLVYDIHIVIQQKQFSCVLERSHIDLKQLKNCLHLGPLNLVSHPLYPGCIHRGSARCLS